MSQTQVYTGCEHDNRDFLVIYKTKLDEFGEKIVEDPKVLCKDCIKNPDYVNDSDVDIIFNILTGAIVR